MKPQGFDSYVQQFDRLVNQQDKIIHTAQYSGYLEWKKKGAPVGFNAPADGLPATPESWGIPTDGPHPNAARLFVDWFLSRRRAEGDVRQSVPAFGPGTAPRRRRAASRSKSSNC